MNLIYGSIAIGKAMPLIEFFMRAVGNARIIFGTISRVSAFRLEYFFTGRMLINVSQVPPIDIESEGEKKIPFEPDIEFKNVSFHYPSRPDMQVTN